jgi:hypothetical protein
MKVETFQSGPNQLPRLMHGYSLLARSGLPSFPDAFSWAGLGVWPEPAVAISALDGPNALPLVINH